LRQLASAEISKRVRDRCVRCRIEFLSGVVIGGHDLKSSTAKTKRRLLFRRMSRVGT
jgi:hypothetical protein